MTYSSSVNLNCGSCYYQLKVVDRGIETQLRVVKIVLTLYSTSRANPYPADHDYCRFSSVLLVDQINTIGDEMSVQTSRFENICAPIKQI